MRRVCTGLVLTAACAGWLLMPAAGALAQGSPPVAELAGGSASASKNETTIAVNGTARVFRAPDYVDINVSVISHEKTAGETQADASAKMSKVIEAVKRLNLEQVELQTGSVRMWPRYITRRTGREELPEEQILVGHSAEISIRIRTADIESVPRALDAAIAAGAGRVDEVEFGIREAIGAREEAIRLATQAASRKAQVLAESLELRIGRIVTAGSTTQQNAWWGRYGNRMMSQMSGGMEQGSADDGQSPVVPGQIEIWAEVNLTVAAEPRR